MPYPRNRVSKCIFIALLIDRHNFFSEFKNAKFALFASAKTAISYLYYVSFNVPSIIHMYKLTGKLNSPIKKNKDNLIFTYIKCTTRFREYLFFFFRASQISRTRLSMLLSLLSSSGPSLEDTKRARESITDHGNRRRRKGASGHVPVCRNVLGVPRVRSRSHPY